MNHPSLSRILKQIEEHKGELAKPENSMQSFLDSTMAEAPGKPVENVRDFLTDEELDNREELLKGQETRLVPPTVPPEAPPERQAEGEQVEGEQVEGEQVEEGQEEDRFEEAINQADMPIPAEVQEYLDSEKEEYSFHSIYDLRDFFQKHRSDFEEWAHPAVDSVLSAVESITRGCKCKHKERTKMVEDYYKSFIQQNQHTSLITKIKELLKTKKIKFYSTDVSSNKEELFLEV